MKDLLKLYKRYLKEHKFKALLGPFFKLVEACFELIVPLVIKDIIDIGIKERNDINYVLKMGGLLFLFALVGLLATLITQYFAANVSMKVGTKLRKELKEHISTLSLKELDEISYSTLQTTLTNDTLTFQNSVAMFIRLVVRAPFIVIGATIMSFTISLKIGCIFVLASFAIGFILYFIMKYSLPYNRRIQKDSDDVTRITKENLTGVRVVRAFNKQKFEQDRYNKKCDDLELVSIRLAKLSSLLNPLVTLVINFAIVAILYFGAREVNLVNGLTNGEVTSLLNYMSQISIAISVVANLVIVFSKASSSSERIQKIFNLKSSLKEGNIENVSQIKDDLIEFKDVSFAYHKGSDFALKDINFKIKKGQFIGIIGGTGSGKTTIINLLTRLYDVDKGEILINDINVKDYKFSYLRNLISVVPQNPVLFSGTIRSNLSFRNKNVTDEEIWHCLDLSLSSEFVKEKENQLDEEVLQNGKNFSGGQRQRLTLARALINKPTILILDDASSALDYQTDSLIRTNLKTLKDMTIIMISQRAASLKNADQIIVLDNSQIAAIGTHDNLYKTCSIYKEIYSLQTKESGLNEK